MAAEATISGLIGRLSQLSFSDRTEALEELKTAVATLPASELRAILPNISIANVFDCLDTQDQSQQKLCGEVLDRMLSTLSASVVLENFHPHLLAWIKLADSHLKALCLHQLVRLSREVPSKLCLYEDLVLAVVSQLSSDCLDVGPAAAAVLTHMGRDPNGLRVLFGEAMVRKVMDAMSKNDVTRFRVYQLVTDLSALSPMALEVAVQSGVLQQLVNEVQRDDILVQLNAIELVSDLARSAHGLRYLDQQGIVQHLEDMMRDLTNHPLAGLLLPGLVKFFGGLAKHHPKEVLGQFQHFVQLVLAEVTGSDPGLRGVAIETIGLIGSTPEGKLALEKLGNPVTDCMQGMGSCIKTGTSELKVRSLHAMAQIVFLPVEDQTVELLTLTERWFTTSMSEPFETIWSIAQQPFSDLRIPALQLLQSLAHTPWAQKLMNSAPGFKEYVLDRATENSKEGKEEKFELVNILAHSPTVVDIFGQPYQLKLREYFNQGPFYVLAQSEVAMEGEG